MQYNWQQPDWPNFTYDLQKVEPLMMAFSENTGYLKGLIEHMEEEAIQQLTIETMIAEALKTSEIEGEYLSRQDVASSIKNNLGITTILPVKDKRAAGIGGLMTRIRENYDKRLTHQSLFDWHRLLMTGNQNIAIGQYRSKDEPMQVVSGRIGRETVHFEAPPSEQLASEMDQFLQWFNRTRPEGDKSIQHATIRSAIAHLYFESIHPFEDGNGRMGRAISELVLYQHFRLPLLFSISVAIEKEKAAYYTALQKAQRSNEVTPWLEYFLDTLLKALQLVNQKIKWTLQKTTLFDKFNDQLNDRHRKVLRKMLEAEDGVFEGGMSAKKYMSITRSSKATATRDLQQLVAMGIFRAVGNGRSRRYEIIF